MTTNDGITDHEQYAAACRYQNGFLGRVDPITAFMAGSEWARTHLTAQDPTEATTPGPPVDYHAMWWKAEGEREKAERERDEARADAESLSRQLYDAQQDADMSRAELEGEPRPLTPDAITDEMVRRAKAELEMRAGGDYYPETLEAVLTAALTEPPARPEGAEEWEDWLIEALPHESMPDEDIARLADQIAARAARRDEETTDDHR